MGTPLVRQPAYGRKRRLVRNLWLASLPLMLLLPLAAKLALGLGTTLLGLVILDETP
jgi:hypothetical protein